MSQQEPHHQHHHHHHDTLPAKLAAGGLSCMAVSFILNPMDVIKCRMQARLASHFRVSHLRVQLILLFAQIQVKAPNMTELPYRNFPQSFAKIFSEEGVRGLFKGCVLSLKFHSRVTVRTSGTDSSDLFCSMQYHCKYAKRGLVFITSSRIIRSRQTHCCQFTTYLIPFLVFHRFNNYDSRYDLFSDKGDITLSQKILAGAITGAIGFFIFYSKCFDNLNFDF
jgi:hypothetical protein